MSKDIVNFSKSLRNLLSKRGDATKLSKATGISESSISNYLKGYYGYMPSSERLIQMAEYFRISVDKLLGRE